MIIVLIGIELILLSGVYFTRKVYKNENTILFSNDSEFIETLPEEYKSDFIQASRALTLKLFYLLMIAPPFVYFLYICNFNNMSMTIFTLIFVGGIIFSILNKMIQLQNEYKDKIL